MHITWLGHSCFKIQDKTGSDAITIVTDPFDANTGFKVPNFEADIVTVSHSHHDHNNADALRGKPFIINAAGEYDVKGISIEGIDSHHDEKEGAERGRNIIYWMEMEGIAIVHLGDLGHVLTDKQLEKIGKCDILMIPVGGKYTIDAKKAVEVINQIEPRIVIPMHYKTVGGKITDIDGVEKFVKELGIKPTEEEKLKISKKDLPQEDMELVILRV
jgi:L-ascorbate metabolism protein UlaG (beta-lactamase superfamily)